MITFVRVDDRVIHGQTITCWLAEMPCDGIIIVDDELSANTLMQQVYQNTVPSGIRVLTFSVEKTLRKLEEACHSTKRYFLIFRCVHTLRRLLAAGATLPGEINVGPASTRPGTKVIVPTIGLDEAECAAYREIAEKGYHISFQIVPGARRVSWQEAEKKL